MAETPGANEKKATSSHAGSPLTKSSKTHPTTQSIPLTDKHRWRAYWVCVAVAAVTILDLSKVNVALPSIEQALDAGSTEIQLIVSGYVLTFGLTLVPMGRLGDQRSRRMLFIVGLSLFTVASVACALAPTAEFLLVARLVQGIAAGIQMPQVLGLIQQLFQGAERGKAFGLFGATIGIATAFGPTLGGLAIALGGPEDGWRWIFWMNVPLGIIAIALAALLLPDTRMKSRRKLDLDPVGTVLFGLTVLALMWPFLFTTGAPTDDPRRWWLLAVFVMLAASFIAWERRYEASGRSPLVPLKIFRITSFRNGTLLATAYLAALPAVFLLTTLYLQFGLGLEALYAGMVTIGFALASAGASWVGGLLVNRLGRPLVVGGLVVVLVASGVLVVVATLVPPAAAPWAMAATMLVAGLGGGLVISPNQTLQLADIPVRQGGLAGSVGQLGQRIGTAVGTAVALALFFSTVYDEGGEAQAGLAVYRDAYSNGMMAVGIFLALAFAVGVIDISTRQKKKTTKKKKQKDATASS